MEFFYYVNHLFATVPIPGKVMNSYKNRNESQMSEQTEEISWNRLKDIFSCLRSNNMES